MTAAQCRTPSLPSRACTTQVILGLGASSRSLSAEALLGLQVALVSGVALNLLGALLQRGARGGQILAKGA